MLECYIRFCNVTISNVTLQHLMLLKCRCTTVTVNSNISVLKCLPNIPWHTFLAECWITASVQSMVVHFLSYHFIIVLYWTATILKPFSILSHVNKVLHSVCTCGSVLIYFVPNTVQRLNCMYFCDCRSSHTNTMSYTQGNECVRSSWFIIFHQ